MTDQPKTPPVGEPDGTGGAGGEGEGSGGGGSPKQTVSYDTHRKLLDEKKRLQTERDALTAEKADRERKDAEAKGDYQKLLDQERAALADERKKREGTEAKLASYEEQEKGRRKLAAILTNVGATVDSKYYGLLPIDDVLVDPTTGEIDQNSVTRAVEKTKKQFPEILKGVGGPGMPKNQPGANGGTPGTIRYSDWKNLPSVEMDKWKREQIVD